MHGGGSIAYLPITCIDYLDAVRFVNWLHNGQGTAIRRSTPTLSARTVRSPGHRMPGIGLKREELMQAYLLLKAWPEVPSALQSLREAGVRFALLSNMTPKMLEAGMESTGLTGLFEHALSTDQVRTYKSDPERINWQTTRLGLSATTSSLSRLQVGMRRGPSGLAIQHSGSTDLLSQKKSWE